MPSRNEGQKWLGPIQAGIEANQNQANRPMGMPPLCEIKSEAQRMGLTEEDAEAIHDHWLTNGFRTRTGKIRDWRANMRTWCRQGWFPSQKQGSNRGTPQFTPPTQAEFLAYICKKYTTSHGLRLYRYLVARGWKYYGEPIVSDDQWKSICHTHEFRDP